MDVRDVCQISHLQGERARHLEGYRLFHGLDNATGMVWVLALVHTAQWPNENDTGQLVKCSIGTNLQKFRQ